MLKVIISGILGHMGQRVMEVCLEDPGVEIVAGIDMKEGNLDGIPLFSSPDSCNVSADVLIDFSNSELSNALCEWCSGTKTALVMCTTGHTGEQLERLRELSEEVPVFRSANMSIGIAVLRELAGRAAALLGGGFDVEIIERHHHRKVDAPSGTAKLLAEAVNEAAGGRYEPVYDRHSVRQKRASNEIGMHSVRGGTIVGIHEVLFCGNDEVLTLSHEATSRAVYASGALSAARFLQSSPPGMYDMDSIVSSLMENR